MPGTIATESTMTTEEIKKMIRNVPDFPKPGIMFRDFTPLIADARGSPR